MHGYLELAVVSISTVPTAYILRTLVIYSLCGWYFQVDSLIIISIILYHIPTEVLSEHGRSQWPLACLSFWPHLRQLLLQFLRFWNE